MREIESEKKCKYRNKKQGTMDCLNCQFNRIKSINDVLMGIKHSKPTKGTVCIADEKSEKDISYANNLYTCDNNTHE